MTKSEESKQDNKQEPVELTEEQKQELQKKRDEELKKLQTTLKVFREELENYTQHFIQYPIPSREVGIALERIQEAKMWLGKELGRLGSEDLNASRDKDEVQAYFKAKEVTENLVK